MWCVQFDVVVVALLSSGSAASSASSPSASSSSSVNVPFFLNFLVFSDFLFVKMRIERLYFRLSRGWGYRGYHI